MSLSSKIANIKKMLIYFFTLLQLISEQSEYFLTYNEIPPPLLYVPFPLNILHPSSATVLYIPIDL